MSNSTERHADNSGIMQTYDLLKFAIARSNGSIFSYKHNTKCPSSCDQQEWCNKKIERPKINGKWTNALQWTVHCTRKSLLTVLGKNYANYKQLSRSVNYLSQSCQQSSIQPIRSWYQELVSWNGGISGMSTGSPASHSLSLTESTFFARRIFFSDLAGSLFAG